MSIQVKMKNKFILIKDLDEDGLTETESGLFVPKDKLEVGRTAIVLAAGDCDKVKKGDIVYKIKGNGTPIILNDIKMEMIHIDFILGVIENGETATT